MMDSSCAGGPSNSGASPVSPVDSGRGSTSNKMRKRTKTGCLTCRKRRIKCGEERPTCANCIRSKRQCEGYNQRVVFKPPIGDWPNHPGVVSTMQFHNSLLPGTRAFSPGNASPLSPAVPSSAAEQLGNTQSDLSHAEPGTSLEHPHIQRPLMRVPSTFPNDPNYQQPTQFTHHHQPLHSPQSQIPPPTSATSYFSSQPSPVHAPYSVSYTQSGPPGYDAQHRFSRTAQYPHDPASYDTDSKPAQSQLHPSQSVYLHTQRPIGTLTDQPYHLGTLASSRAEGYSTYSANTPSFSPYDNTPRGAPGVGAQYASFPATAHEHSPHPHVPSVHIPHDDVTPNVKFLPHSSQALEPITTSEAPEYSQPQQLSQPLSADSHVSLTQVLEEAAVEYQDDDYYDVQSDEAMLGQDTNADQQDFSLIQRMHRESTNGLEVRRYDAFIYEGIMIHDHPEQVANPLRNHNTARIFAHFIHVIGPTLSIYDRNPRNSSSFYEGRIPPSQQSLWTYTLPLVALKHQALFHAMLALASVHMARIQKASVTPSYKHYAYSLKRLGKALGNPKKRLSIPTLATSLLLAFYEVMTAEHGKWSTHLVGAAQLIAELDFRSLTQQARRLKATQTAQEENSIMQNPSSLVDLGDLKQRRREKMMMPDARLVSTIIGRAINYDDFGGVLEDSDRSQQSKNATNEMDLQSYQTFQDLYWYHTRHDMLQSIISGNPLSMDYSKWPDCPPRAPLGRTDAMFGSHDHIILLLGRIADFIVRDRGRKVRQVEANGGHWRPTPGMPGLGGSLSQSAERTQEPFTPTRPSSPPSHKGMDPRPGWPDRASVPSRPVAPSSTNVPPRGQTQPKAPRQAGPGFYGMRPSQGPLSLPSSYASPNQTHTPPTTPNFPKEQFSNLTEAYQAALREWDSICHAHATIVSLLSNTPAFAPLSADSYPTDPGSTPFGSTLLYRSYDISILWSFLHLAQILLLRSHPAMPPAAMVAAAVSASATQPYAVLIGRITAGIPLFPSPSSDYPLNGHSRPPSLTPALGAVHIESTTALLFAGVQFQNPAQREWLISRLLDIERQTGWASAGVIARSCETAWERAGEAHKGPPYERRTRPFGEHEYGRPERSENVERSAGGAPNTNNTARRDDSGRNQGSASGAAPAGHFRSQDQAGSQDRTERRHGNGFAPWAIGVTANDEDLLRAGMERVELDRNNDQMEYVGMEGTR